VGEVKTVEFEPIDFTAAELFIAAVYASHSCGRRYLLNTRRIGTELRTGLDKANPKRNFTHMNDGIKRRRKRHTNPRGFCQAIANHLGYSGVTYVSDVLRRKRHVNTKTDAVLSIKRLAAQMRAVMDAQEVTPAEALALVVGKKNVTAKRKAARAAGPKGGGQ
jgi:hypothetical protein